NFRYKEIFTVPETRLPKFGGRIMSLQEPTSKMSKSDANQKGFISLMDDPNAAAKKIRSAVTDSEMIVKYDKENKPGISNLLVIYSSFTDYTIEEIEKMYEGKTYGDFKKDLGEIVKEFLIDFQEKVNYYLNSEELDEILDEGQDRAFKKTIKMLRKMEHAVGLGRKRKYKYGLNPFFYFAKSCLIFSFTIFNSSSTFCSGFFVNKLTITVTTKFTIN